mgnify:CR=1 FL=1
MMTFAKTYLGQHFLHDQKVLQAIVEAADIQSEDTVVEIGAGKGVLTVALLQKQAQVYAYEIDRDCFPELENLVKNYPNLHLIKKSVLTAESPQADYKVVANIPYYLTGTILRLFLHIFRHQPDLMVLLIQKEVAKKITSSETSLLSLAVQVYGRAQIIRQVSKGAFTPPPKVESAIIRLTKHPQPVLHMDAGDFFRFLRPCFQGSRKQIQVTIRHQVSLSRDEVIDMLQSLHIDGQTRPSKLSLAQWEQIVHKFLPYTSWKVTSSPSPKSS